MRIAALNEPYLGDLQGIRGADFACYRQGRRAGLLGTFKAFLSSRYVHILSLLFTFVFWLKNFKVLLKLILT